MRTLLQIATIISIVFEPLLVLSVLTLYAGVIATLSTDQFIQYLLILLVVTIGPVFVFRMWLVKKKGIDWDIHDRRKRIKPLLALCAFMLVDVLLIQYLANPVLSHLFMVFLVWIVGFSIVTLKWKISGHSGVVALASGTLVYWLGFSWWPILLITPLVGWARVIRKDHTLAQVIVGALYSWLVLIVLA